MQFATVQTSDPAAYFFWTKGSEYLLPLSHLFGGVVSSSFALISVKLFVFEVLNGIDFCLVRMIVTAAIATTTTAYSACGLADFYFVYRAGSLLSDVLHDD